VKAISVCQPWAWLIVAGDKPIENRTWFTRYRGFILIHAGKSRSHMTKSGLDAAFLTDAAPLLAFGAIIGMCEVVDCVHITHPRIRGMAYAEGPWCWLLKNRVHFGKPIPWRGQPGIFEVPNGVVDGVTVFAARGDAGGVA
jgi:hypothetical protein